MTKRQKRQFQALVDVYNDFKLTWTSEELVAAFLYMLEDNNGYLSYRLKAATNLKAYSEDIGRPISKQDLKNSQYFYRGLLRRASSLMRTKDVREIVIKKITTFCETLRLDPEEVIEHYNRIKDKIRRDTDGLALELIYIQYKPFITRKRLVERFRSSTEQTMKNINNEILRIEMVSKKCHISALNVVEM